MHRYQLAGLIGLNLLTAAPAANAGIICHEGYQRVGASEISTPYCRDTYLAEVARQHGSKVTAAQVRDNPNIKAEVCRWIGRDNRVRDTCNNVDGGSRGR